MKTLFNNRKSKIKKGEPLTEKGLIFYPITMKYYDEFQQHIQALIIRQGTLPVKYLSYDYLNAVAKLEFDNGESTGILLSNIILLYMSLRIDIDFEEMSKSLILSVGDNGLNVQKIIVNQNGNIVELTSLDYSTIIRPLIAEQNGVEIPDESENIDIIKDFELLKEKQSKNNLKIDNGDLIASVAAYEHIREKDIYEWTIREFEQKVKAITRIENYRIYTQAEMGGMVTFKSGNPVPSWCYDKIDNSYGTVEFSQIQKTLGEAATPE